MLLGVNDNTHILSSSARRTSGKRRTGFWALGNVLQFPCLISSIQSKPTNSFFPGGQRVSPPDWLPNSTWGRDGLSVSSSVCNWVIGVFAHAPSPPTDPLIAIDRTGYQPKHTIAAAARRQTVHRSRDTKGSWSSLCHPRLNGWPNFRYLVTDIRTACTLRARSPRP